VEFLTNYKYNCTDSKGLNIDCFVLCLCIYDLIFLFCCLCIFVIWFSCCCWCFVSQEQLVIS